MFKMVSRLRNIVSANVNDLIDSMEKPEKLLRQAVREMEDSISQTQKAASGVMADKTLLDKEIEKETQQISFWQEQTETALASKNDDLARQAIANRREHQTIMTSLKDQARCTNQSIESLCKQLQGMQAKCDEAKRKLNALSARQRAADIRQRTTGLRSKYDIKTDAFDQFDRMKEKVEQAEARADAMRVITQQQCNIPTPIAVEQGSKDFEEQSIEKELSELKNSLNT